AARPQPADQPRAQLGVPESHGAVEVGRQDQGAGRARHGQPASSGAGGRAAAVAGAMASAQVSKIGGTGSGEPPRTRDWSARKASTWLARELASYVITFWCTPVVRCSCSARSSAASPPP